MEVLFPSNNLLYEPYFTNGNDDLLTLRGRNRPSKRKHSQEGCSTKWLRNLQVVVQKRGCFFESIINLFVGLCGIHQGAELSSLFCLSELYSEKQRMITQPSKINEIRNRKKMEYICLENKIVTQYCHNVIFLNNPCARICIRWSYNVQTMNNKKIIHCNICKEFQRSGDCTYYSSNCTICFFFHSSPSPTTLFCFTLSSIILSSYVKLNQTYQICALSVTLFSLALHFILN